MKKIILLLFTLLSIILAQGYISVFTDNNNSDIYIDGQRVGREQIVKYAVNSNDDHFVKVKYKGATVHSEVVNVREGRTKIVVAENFVDFKTNVANRGAIEVEAMRIRETRGNNAFGIFGNSPSAGLSYKSWLTDRIGIQIIGYSNTYPDQFSESKAGGRLLFSLAERVFDKNTFTTYFALGAGKMAIRGTDENFDESISELAFGIEMSLGGMFESLSKRPAYKKSVTIEKNIATKTVKAESYEGVDLGMTFLLAAFKGIFAISHISLELGFEEHWQRFYYEKEPARSNNGKVAGGLHIYF